MDVLAQGKDPRFSPLDCKKKAAREGEKEERRHSKKTAMERPGRQELE